MIYSRYLPRRQLNVNRREHAHEFTGHGLVEEVLPQEEDLRAALHRADRREDTKDLRLLIVGKFTA